MNLIILYFTITGIINIGYLYHTTITNSYNIFEKICCNIVAFITGFILIPFLIGKLIDKNLEK